MKYYFSTILLFVFGVCFSQIKLQGYVKDSLGNGLELANVIAINKATSALDFDTERKVVSSIMNLDKNLTIIMIAHRLNILSNFDRVIELNTGKVIKEGKPKDILNL